MLFWLPAWSVLGKAHLKEELGLRAALDVTTLPLNDAVLALIDRALDVGREGVLCTASDRGTAKRVAARLNLLDRVMASDGVRVLAGPATHAALVDAIELGATHIHE